MQYADVHVIILRGIGTKTACAHAFNDVHGPKHTSQRACTGSISSSRTKLWRRARSARLINAVRP